MNRMKQLLSKHNLLLLKKKKKQLMKALEPEVIGENKEE